MSDESAIHVNFGRPMALFPLDKAILLPQQAIPLHVFEPRYRQMVERVLDASGQIAMAMFEGSRWKEEYHGRPPLKPAVCVGQIVQHERLEDGRYNVIVQGVCRARIVKESAPAEGRLYREAMLEPVAIDPTETDELRSVRSRLAELLESEPLSRMAAAGPILKYVESEDVPTTAIMELVSFLMIGSAGRTYQLLEQPDAMARAEIIFTELDRLSQLIRHAASQVQSDWPKGSTWN